VKGKDTSYEVGYGRPPVNTRFVKGQSGNRAGRPRGSKNLDSIIEHEAQQLVTVHGAGGTRKVTKLHAAAIQLANKAAQGDPRAQRELFAQIRGTEEAAVSNAPPTEHSEPDLLTIENLLRRMQRKSTGSSPTNGIVAQGESE
jgi:Family of unknown function (DUF5681)